MTYGTAQFLSTLKDGEELGNKLKKAISFLETANYADMHRIGRMFCIW